MATLTRVYGSIYNAQGAVVTTGRLRLTLPQDMISVDGTKVAPFSIDVDLATVGGAVDIDIYATEGATPSGLKYVVEYDPDPSDTSQPARKKDGYWSNYWAVPDTVQVPLGNFSEALRGEPSYQYMPLGGTIATAADSLSLGSGTDTTKEIIASQATTSPSIRYNHTTLKWELSHDGATFEQIATPTTGDITGITAGDGLTGGGDTGAVSLAIDTATVARLSTNTFTGVQKFANGSAAAPSITFASDTGKGLYSPASGYLGFAVGGVAESVLGAGGWYNASTNFIGWSNGDPFSGTLDTILLRDAANTLAQRNGTNAQTHRWYYSYTDASNYARTSLRYSGTNAIFGPEQAGTGTVSDLYIGTSGASALHLMTGGTSRFNISTAGHLLAATDNTYDIGASVANRPRDLYVGRTARFQYAGVAPTQLTALFGADASASTLTTLTTKDARLGFPHYDNTEEPGAFAFLSSGSGANSIYIGGGTSLMNAATQISFVTAANNTTPTGTVRWVINSSGNFLANTDNAYDIGSSGASRPRTVFAATSFTGPGTSATTGSVRLANATNINWRNAANTADLGLWLSATDAITTDAPFAHPDGSAAAPSITFASELDNGWYRPFDGAIAYANAGAAQFLLSADVARGLTMGTNQPIGWSSGAATTVPDVTLRREAANTLAQRNGTNAQAFRVYNTYTDASNYERGFIGWSSNAFHIQTGQAGTGLSRALRLGTTGSESVIVATNTSDRWYWNGSGHFLAATDNVYDIGASAATRPRSVYVGTSVIGPGTVSGSGVVRMANAAYVAWRNQTNTADLGIKLNSSNQFHVDSSLDVYGRHFVLGDSETAANARTNSTTKWGNMTAPHYLAAEEYTHVISAYNTNTRNYVHIGGGLTGSNNAATDIIFATAADNITTNGTQRWTIPATGHFLAGADNAYDIGASGATRPRSVYVGTSVVNNGDYLGSGSVRAGSTSGIYWQSRSMMRSPSDGVIVAANQAETSFTRLVLGTADVNGIAIQKSGTQMQFTLGDGSTYIGLRARAMYFNDGSTEATIAHGTGSPEGVVTAAVGSMWLRSNGGAGTSVYIKETGSGNTGWAVIGAGAGHSLLSSTHTDTTAAVVQRGDLITGQGASPAWARLAKGAANTVLMSDGTDLAWSSNVPLLNAVNVFTGSGSHQIAGSSNGVHSLDIKNATTGTAASSRLRLYSDGNDNFVLTSYSTGFSTSGLGIAGSGLINVNTSAGLSIAASHASGAIRFYSGGSTERMSLSSGGLLSVSGFGAHSFDSGGTGGNILTVRNTTAGTGNYAMLRVGNDARLDHAYLMGFSTTYTTSAPHYADGVTFGAGGSGGLSIVAGHASGNVRVYAGGTEYFRVTSSGDVDIKAGKKLYLDGGGDTYISEPAANNIGIVVNGAPAWNMSATLAYTGSTHDLAVSSGKKLYLDGGGDTYITETSANVLRFYVNGTDAIIIDSAANVYMNAGKKFYVDGGVDTYFYESTGNNLEVVTGGIQNAKFGASGAFNFAPSSAANSPYNNTSGAAANLGIDSTGAVYRSTSSLRYKTDVRDIPEQEFDKVLELRPVTFKSTSKIDDGDRRYVGFIAEDVDQHIPEVVNYDEQGRPDALQYDRIIAYAVGKIKQLAAKVAALEAKLGAV